VMVLLESRDFEGERPWSGLHWCIVSFLKVLLLKNLFYGLGVVFADGLSVVASVQSS
jgi:hypothetical protein